MKVDFAPSARSTVGLEWELMLVDPATGELVGRGPEIIDQVLAAASPDDRYSAST